MGDPRSAESTVLLEVRNAFAATVFVSALASMIGAFPGHLDGGIWPLYVPETHGHRSSQHLFDPYRSTYIAEMPFSCHNKQFKSSSASLTLATESSRITSSSTTTTEAAVAAAAASASSRLSSPEWPGNRSKTRRSSSTCSGKTRVSEICAFGSVGRGVPSEVAF